MKSMRHEIYSILNKNSVGHLIVSIYGGYTLSRNFKADCRRLRRVGPEALLNINKIAKKIGLRYFANYGTLLGLIRDNGFIKHDKDIDLCVESGTFSPRRLMIALLETGFTFYRAFEFNNEITEVSFKYNCVPIDFFFLEKENDKLMLRSYHWEKNMGNSWRMSKCYMPYVTNINEDYKFPGYDFKIPIPENYEEILTANYGNWRVPIKKWDFNDGDKYTKEVKAVKERGMVVGIERVLQIG